MLGVARVRRRPGPLRPPARRPARTTGTCGRGSPARRRNWPSSRPSSSQQDVKDLLAADRQRRGRRRRRRAAGPPAAAGGPRRAAAGGQDAGPRPVHHEPDRPGQGRARSTRSSAATSRSARSSTSSPAAGRTTRSSPARPASARPPSSRGSPCGSPPATCRRRSRTCSCARSTWPVAGRGRREGRVREPAQVGHRRGEVVARCRSSCSSTRPTRSSAPAARPGRATPPTCSSRPWPAASCGPSRPPRSPSTRSTSRPTPP